jgi:hypothetical protein
VDDGLRGKTFRCRVCSSPIKATADFAIENASPERRSSAPAAKTSQRPSRAASAAPKSTHAAVVRQRDDERSKRDLFGQEIQLSAKVVEHGGPASAFTAARSENSVLFSLDQLAKPQLPETASAAPVRAKADSGLIDLNALMNDQLDPKSIRPAPLSEPPLGAFTREVQPTPAAAFEITPLQGSKKRNKLVAAAGALAVAALVTIGIVATNHEDARVAAAAQAAAPKPAEPPAPVVKDPTPPPAPTVETKAQAPAETASSSDTGNHRSSKGRKAGKSKGSSASASAPAAPAPKKAADPCGCHGDLLCNMKCSSH